MVGLLALIKKFSYGLDDKQYDYWNKQAATKRFYALKQGPTESLADFAERFNDQLAVTESVCGELTPRTLDGQTAKKMAAGREKFLACVFLAAVDRGRYKATIDEL